ncbi:GHKL domain-containing protein [Clostridium boliviensis]|uniref:GHKL domain-containing protein n=1 Tax=Clostridium boliviensis TaxID=318465 RepID=A0ABU4GNV4_9CLOT|nr:GHKL domain-containing protein [Clostridium boliviensis]
MNILSATVVSPFLSLFYILVIRKCINAFFVPSWKKPTTYIIWVAYYFFQLFLGIRNGISPVLTLLINMIFVFLATSISYSESWKKCALFSFLICAIWMLVEIIIHMILNMLHLDDKAGLSGAIISKIVMLVFAIVTGHCLQHKSTGDISFRYMAILLMVPAGSIYIMHNVFLISSTAENELLFSFISGILMMLINYIIFEVFESLAANSEYQKKTLLYEQQLELCGRQAEEREIQNTQIRLLRHDMKQHLITILGMVNSGKNQDAATYLTALLEKGNSKKIHEISHSGNIVVDSLVNYKCSVARKQNIEFSTNIFIPPTMPFQNGNLTIILGNLLENALEACRQMKTGHPKIELEMSYQKGILSIVVWNTFEGERFTDGQKHFLTTKKNPAHHGLGLFSIEQAVAACNGEAITQVRGNIFKAVVILYQEPEE